jgi:hypothetical protein
VPDLSDRRVILSYLHLQVHILTLARGIRAICSNLKNYPDVRNPAVDTQFKDAPEYTKI